jgi:hypothetical protein
VLTFVGGHHAQVALRRADAEGVSRLPREREALRKDGACPLRVAHSLPVAPEVLEDDGEPAFVPELAVDTGGLLEACPGGFDPRRGGLVPEGRQAQGVQRPRPLGRGRLCPREV